MSFKTIEEFLWNCIYEQNCINLFKKVMDKRTINAHAQDLQLCILPKIPVK
jgi:hypothetical protein